MTINELHLSIRELLKTNKNVSSADIQLLTHQYNNQLNDKSIEIIDEGILHIKNSETPVVVLKHKKDDVLLTDIVAKERLMKDKVLTPQQLFKLAFKSKVN